jgi:hypothetical protein
VLQAGKPPRRKPCHGLPGEQDQGRPHLSTTSQAQQLRGPLSLTAIWGCDCDGLRGELIIKVPCVHLRCDLRFEWWQELRRRRAQTQGPQVTCKRERPLGAPVEGQVRELTFFCTTSCQLMLRKNLCSMTSLASLGPPPSLGRDGHQLPPPGAVGSGS